METVLPDDHQIKEKLLDAASELWRRLQNDPIWAILDKMRIKQKKFRPAKTRTGGFEGSIAVCGALTIQIWLDKFLDGKELHFWVGFNSGNTAYINSIIELCREYIFFIQVINETDTVETNGISHLKPNLIYDFNAPEHEDFQGGKFFGVYSYPRDSLDCEKSIKFVIDVLRCLPEFEEALKSNLAAIEKLKISDTEKELLQKARIGQSKFRTDLDIFWGGKCAVLGASTREVLRASHVQPWSESSDVARLDPNNGLLLSAHLDALFDRYLISFEDDGLIKISDSVDDETRSALGLQSKLRLRKGLSPESREYLARHREHWAKHNSQN